MKPKLINKCKNTYKPDPLKVTEKILEKIPNKFIVGLKKINFHDRSNDPVIKYTLGKKGKGVSKIDIYMEGFSNKGKFSLYHYNFIFLPTISDHIVKYLQPISNDPEIKAVVRHRYNSNWVYMGSYTYIMAPINFLRFLYNRLSGFRSAMNRFINRILDKHSNTT